MYFQACSFLLSTQEVLDYGQLYNACVMLLLAGTGADKVKDKLTLLVIMAKPYYSETTLNRNPWWKLQTSVNIGIDLGR